MSLNKNCNSLHDNKIKYQNFINSNKNEISINGDIINKDNVIQYYEELSDDQKKKITVYELNILYYLLNSFYKRYIESKTSINSMIKDSILFQRRSDALINA